MSKTEHNHVRAKKPYDQEHAQDEGVGNNTEIANECAGETPIGGGFVERRQGHNVVLMMPSGQGRGDEEKSHLWLRNSRVTRNGRTESGHRAHGVHRGRADRARERRGVVNRKAGKKQIQSWVINEKNSGGPAVAPFGGFMCKRRTYPRALRNRRHHNKGNTSTKSWV